jgi:hypothetical protein
MQLGVLNVTAENVSAKFRDKLDTLKARERDSAETQQRQRDILNNTKR